jgi:hypothetical protein
MSSRITHRFRVACDICIRIEPQFVPLYAIHREEHPNYCIIIPGVVVVQSAESIVDLAGIAFGSVDSTHLITTDSVGTVDLLTDDGVLTEAQEHAAQGVSQVEGEMGPIEGSDEMTGEEISI